MPISYFIIIIEIIEIRIVGICIDFLLHAFQLLESSVGRRYLIKEA